MTRSMFLKGRLWVLKSGDSLFSDIDTDMIYHNAHLAVTEIDEMGQYAFGNLEGYKNFASEAQPGDIILTGENFGSGSSRQHAVECFIALGVQAVIARSFGAIYKRNAINSGFPIIELPGLPDGLFNQFDEIELDLEKGILASANKNFQGNPMSEVARDIYLAGGLFQYAEQLQHPELLLAATKVSEMYFEVDQEICFGCGACTVTCPEVFSLVNGKSNVIANPVHEDYQDCANSAEDGCPVTAISHD